MRRAGREGAGEIWAQIRANVNHLRAGPRGLTDEEVAEILSKDDFDADPRVRVRAAGLYLDHVRAGAVGPLDDEALAYEIGFLFAMGASALLDWSLLYVKSPVAPQGAHAVVARDGSRLLMPSQAVYELLIAPGAPNRLVETILAQLEGPGASSPGSYTLLAPVRPAPAIA